jgi:biopolymer transport protein ExbD
MLNKGFNSEEFEAPLAEINMTPFIDIMLVLLVIFLITTPIIQSAINLNLPKDKGSALMDLSPISISITSKGEYFLEEKNVDVNDLENHLISISKDHKESPIHIKADENVPYKKVSFILSLLQQQNLNNVSFITNQP